MPLIGLHNINIELLKLDPENPRLPERLKNALERDVLEWMLTDATLTDLMASIAENGFFGGEALIGIEDVEYPGTYVVVEGNRRLAAVKLLSNPGNATYKPKIVKELAEIIVANGKLPAQLPVYIVSTREEVQNYLGFRHVTGVKQWPVIAKARYLYFLFTSRPYTTDIYKQLAREIGSKSHYVRRLIIGYQLFLKILEQNFFDLDYLNEDNFDLSLINDAATKHAGIEEYMGIRKNARDALSTLQKQEFENVFRWLYEKNKDGETRLGESRNLPVLNKVLSTSLAKDKFIIDRLSLEVAAEYTDLANEYLREYLVDVRNKLGETLKLVPRVEFPNQTEISYAKEIVSSAEAIYDQLLRNRSKNSAS